MSLMQPCTIGKLWHSYVYVTFLLILLIQYSLPKHKYVRMHVYLYHLALVTLATYDALSSYIYVIAINMYVHVYCIGESFIQKIINETIDAGIIEQSFPLQLARNNNSIIECTKTLSLILSTQEICKTVTENNSIAEIDILNDDGKELNMCAYCMLPLV